MDEPVDPIAEKINKIGKKTDDTYAVLSTCYKEVESLKKDHSELKDEVGKKAYLDELKFGLDKLSAQLEAISKKLFYLDDHKDMLQVVVRDIKNDSKVHKLKVDDHEEKLSDFRKGFESLKFLIASARTDLDSNMNSTVSRVRKEIHEKIDNLPIPQDAVNLQQVKNCVEDKLSAIALEAKNAFLSSENSDVRLNILEKKIENALIKIKSLELKSQ